GAWGRTAGCRKQTRMGEFGMKFRTMIVPALMAGLAVAAAASLGTDASAQTKDKAAPAPATKAAPAPKGAPAAKGEQPNIQQQVAIPSPWTKICERDPKANKQVCLIAQD